VIFFVFFVVPISPPTNEPDLQALWQAQAEQLLDPSAGRDDSAGRGSPDPALTAQFLVLVTCRDEKEQLELLGRLKEEGRECKALLA
jgi:hypothetical protein